MNNEKTPNATRVEVGQTVVMTDSNYGSYTMRCIAHVNFSPTDVSKKDHLFWFDHYHPVIFFTSGYMLTSENLYDDAGAAYLWVVLDDDNLDWWKNNQSCEYIQQHKQRKLRKCKIPIGLSKRKLDKWLKNSRSFVFQSVDV